MPHIRVTYLMILLLPVFLSAQSDRVAGKIRGAVTDGETGEALVGSNVLIIGTHMGASVGISGEFIIPNIPAGTYNIRADFIGYATQIYEGVEVVQGQTTRQDFTLNIEALAGKAVEVVAAARRQVVTVRSTSAQREISGEDIKKMPVTDFIDVLANSAGAVETEGGRSQGIHIRGGRDGEVAFYVDGINTNDPVTKQKGIEIDNNAVEQIVISSGGFSAEYGESMSGTVSIVTKEGSRDHYTGALEIYTETPWKNVKPDLYFGYNKYTLALGGPLPGLGKLGTFFLSGALEEADVRSPSYMKLDHNGMSLPNGTGKIVISPGAAPWKLILSGSYDNQERYSYNHSISKGDWLKNYYKTESGHRRVGLKLQGALSPKTSYEIQVYRYNVFSDFASQDNTYYTDIRYISTRLDWVEWAESEEWYDTKDRMWSTLKNPDGTDVIKSNWLTYDPWRKDSDGNWFLDGVNWTPLATPVKIADLPEEDQAFYAFYIYERDSFDPAVGTWQGREVEMNAWNDRWHDTGFWYIPAFLDLESNDYNSTDSSVYYHSFDDKAYADFLFGDEDYKVAHQLDGYSDNPYDVHNGWYWDRDLFSVYTYGPGRPRYHEQNTTHNTLEFHMNTQWNPSNEAKIGFKAQQSDLQYVDIQFANQNPYFDSYEYQPTTRAAWIEDKFEYEDLIVSFGLRWDYFNPNASALKNPRDFDEDGDGDIDYVDADPKSDISPRFGISFAVSDKSAMYANYGHFIQTPEYGEIYQNLYTDLTSGLPLVGNPNIDPERTTAYEVGFKHRITDDIGLEISAYYKDVLNLLATRTYNTVFEGNIATVTFQEMEDFAKIKGMDFRLRLRSFYNLSGEITYSYLDAKGTGSSNREFYYLYIYEADRPLPTKEYPLEFDVTHSVKMNLNYYLPPVRTTLRDLLLRNWNFNVQANFNSGPPYTPTDKNGKPLELGSKRMPGTKKIDMRVEKYFPLGQRQDFSIWLDIRNLFDWLNVVNIYSYSGKPDTNGRPPVYERSRYLRYVGVRDPETGQRFNTPEEAYEAHRNLWSSLYKTPFNYSTPRQIRLGVGIRF